MSFCDYEKSQISSSSILYVMLKTTNFTFVFSSGYCTFDNFASLYSPEERHNCILQN